MTHFIFNHIICSGLLFFLYKALLEKEKTHVFKRFYLLFAILLSITAPLLTIELSSADETSVLQVVSEQPASLIIESTVSIDDQGMDYLELFLWVTYIVVVTFTLLRLLKNIHYLLKASAHKTSILFNEASLVLMEQAVSPHSFLKTIFLNKKEYLAGRIETEVMIHELTHVRQYHSLDVLFVQLIQCFFWFNPFLILFRRSIQLNHEFLADDAAARFASSPFSYQQILLEKASGEASFSLASQFNYSTIKKRLVMITKKTSPQISLLKKLAIIPLLAITAFLVAKKETSAQVNEPTKTKVEVPSSSQNASQQLVDEYETIVNKHKQITPKGNTEYSDFSIQEKERLLSIYQKMTKEQQQRQAVGFIPKPPALKKSEPTESQLRQWIDAKKYFVRINGYKIKNDKLTNYRASDFNYVDIYKPNKGSTDYGKYEAQIFLMTREAYAGYLKSWEEGPEYRLVVFAKPRK